MNKQRIFLHCDYNPNSLDIVRSVVKEMRREIDFVVVPTQQRRLIKLLEQQDIRYEEYPLPLLSYNVHFNSMTNMFMPNMFIVHVAYPSPQTQYISQYAKLRNVPLKYI